MYVLYRYWKDKDLVGVQVATQYDETVLRASAENEFKQALVK